MASVDDYGGGTARIGDLKLMKTQEAAIEAIKDACAELARAMMKITPLVPDLKDKGAETKIFETLYELTKNVETIKKQVGKIGKDDASSLL